jgi:predicted dehydrogenase
VSLPPTRVAVVGVGVMGRHHAQNYLAMPGATLVAVVDPSEDAREQAERTFGCPAYATLDAMFANETVDAASVVAPTSEHYAITRDLLQAGVHVLVEKPVATRVLEAEALARLSRERGLVLQVGHITRFFRAVQLLTERIESPYLIEARRMTPSARIQDVGVILDLMIHDIDIVLGLVPADIASVTIAGHSVEASGTEDVAAAQIEFENGCIARFLASRISPDAERSLVVAERERTHRVDFLHDPHTEIALFHARKDDLGDTHVRTDRQFVHEDNPLREQLTHFLDRIVSAAPPVGTLEDDLRSLRVATRLLENLKPSAVPEAVFEAQVN